MPEHGTRSCYVAGCRRPECVRANRDYQRGYWREHYAEEATLEELVADLIEIARRYPVHGTTRRYARGCSCAECRAAHSADVIQRRKERDAR